MSTIHLIALVATLLVIAGALVAVLLEPADGAFVGGGDQQ